MTSFLAQVAANKPLSWDDVLSPYIYVFYVAFAVSFCFTPVMRLVALYYGIIDRPDRVRKMHSVPIAYLGGVAVFLGWLGSQPAEGSYVLMAQMATLFYFTFFLIVMPMLGLVETPRRLPNSITEAVLGEKQQ